MKIGSETGSVINHFYSRGIIGEPIPVVGMGVTMLGWTDRQAGTIHKVEVITDSKLVAYIIEVTRDDARVVSGSRQDGSAEYAFTPRPNGPLLTFRKNKKTGLWEGIRKNPDTDKWVLTRCQGIRIGERDEYYDPSF